VLLRTTVRASVRESAGRGRVTALTLVTRSVQAGADEWLPRLSESLPDWYSPSSSRTFHKVVRNVSAAVVIEATELGDVRANTSPRPPRQLRSRHPSRDVRGRC
jgi:hypothetical protein